jgi:hypothetical protein
MSARKIIREFTNNPYIGLFQHYTVVKKVDKTTQTDACKAIEIGDKIIAAYGDGWESL